MATREHLTPEAAAELASALPDVELVDRHAAEYDRITDAYWHYTRTARGKPPAVTVPDAYTIRSACADEARARRLRLKR